MGALDGVRVIELAGSAPCAFAGTLLADMGADVVRIDRPGARQDSRPADPLGRGRRSVAANLKDPSGQRTVLSLIEHADVLVEGFRPGVCERLGLGPDVCAERNPGLIFGRISGWGGKGGWRNRPGHDITFLALAGALDGDRRAGAPPAPPSTYLSSFAGGGMLLVHGILAALFERSRSGRGQVVDAAMLDGAALLDVLIRQWRDSVGGTVIDAPFYTTYECADGQYVAVGAIEPVLYETLVEQLGLAGERLPSRQDEEAWPLLRDRFAEAFRSRERAHWVKVFEMHEACVVPVLTPEEAARHPAARDRGAYAEVGGALQPAPAPRLSRTPGRVQRPAPRPGEHVPATEILGDWMRHERESGGR